MKKRILGIVMAASMLIGASTAAMAADSLTLGTGGTTGTYYAVGGVMATVLNPVLKESSLTVTSTGASKANIQLVDVGEADLAIVQNDVMYYAFTGTDLFEEEGKYETFSTVAGLYDETVQIVTCDSSIASVADLKGKTVSVGDAGSGTEFNAKQILEAYDMSFDDINVVNASFGDSADSLKDGKIDAAFIVAGAPTTAVVDLATTKDVSLVQLDEEHIKKLQDSYDFYTETVIPAGTYDGVDHDVHTVGTPQGCQTTTALSQQDGYNICKAIFDEAKSVWQAAYPVGANNDLVELTLSSTVPLHAGTVQYLTEIGVEVPEDLIPEEYVPVQ